MKKSILNLGKALNKAEQNQIKGGVKYRCRIYSKGSVPSDIGDNCTAEPIGLYAVEVCCSMHIPT